MVDFWNDFLHVAAFFDGAEIQRPSFDTRRDPQVRAGQLPGHVRGGQPATRPCSTTSTRTSRPRTRSTRTWPGRTSSCSRSASTAATPRWTCGRPRCCRPVAASRDDKYVYRRGPALRSARCTIMGFTHPNDTAAGGEAAAEAYFRYLAMHPSTARYIAQSLATRLVSDTPPAEPGGQGGRGVPGQQGPDQADADHAAVSSTEFWGSVGQKVRRPMEYLVATYRTLGVQPDTPAAFTEHERQRQPVPAGAAPDPAQDGGAGPVPDRPAHPERLPGRLRRLDLGRHDGQRVERGVQHRRRQPADVHLRAAETAARDHPAGDRGGLCGRAGPAPGPPDADPGPEGRRARGGRRPCRPDRASTVDANFNGAIRAVARTILASPQHHLR